MRLDIGSLVLLAIVACLGCGGASSEAAEPVMVSGGEVQQDSTAETPEPARLTPATPEEVAACDEQTSRLNQGLMSRDHTAAAVALDRTHLADDMTSLCDAPRMVPQCFDDGRDSATTLDCLEAHYLCRLRSHHARTTLSALPGGDRESKATLLRSATRDAGLAECALADLFNLP